MATLADTVTVWIYVDPSVAVRHGKTRSGALPLAISQADLEQLSQEERIALAECRLSPDGQRPPHDSWILGNRQNWENSLFQFTEATLGELQRYFAWLAEQTAEAAAKEQRKREVLLQEALVALKERRTYEQKQFSLASGARWNSVHAHTVGQVPEVLALPECQEWLAELERENERRQERAVAEVEAAKLAAEQEARDKEEAEALYQAALWTFVRGVSDHRDIRRIDEGLYPLEEAERLLRDHLFYRAAELPRYERLQSDDVQHSEECQYWQVKFDADDAECLTREQFAQLEGFKRLFASQENTEVVARRHTAECECCEQQAERYSVLVTITWHGRLFSREFALLKDDEHGTAVVAECKQILGID